MASDQELFKPWIKELKIYLHELGRDHRIEGALLCQTLDEAATKFAFAFPSVEKKVKYANVILAGDESYEYEDDEDDQGENEGNNTNEVDAVVLKQLDETKWIADGIRLKHLLEYEKTRVQRMSISELQGVHALLSSLQIDIITQVNARLEQLKAKLQLQRAQLLDQVEDLEPRV